MTSNQWKSHYPPDFSDQDVFFVAKDGAANGDPETGNAKIDIAKKIPVKKIPNPKKWVRYEPKKTFAEMFQDDDDQQYTGLEVEPRPMMPMSK